MQPGDDRLHGGLHLGNFRFRQDPDALAFHRYRRVAAAPRSRLKGAGLYRDGSLTVKQHIGAAQGFTVAQASMQRSPMITVESFNTLTPHIALVRITTSDFSSL